MSKQRKPIVGHASKRSGNASAFHRLLTELQREIVKWHDFEKCGASPELLNRQREKILGLKEVCRGALYATGLDALSWPSSFYTPVPPEMRGKCKEM